MFVKSYQFNPKVNFWTGLLQRAPLVLISHHQLESWLGSEADISSDLKRTLLPWLLLTTAEKPADLSWKNVHNFG